MRLLVGGLVIELRSGDDCAVCFSSMEELMKRFPEVTHEKVFQILKANVRHLDAAGEAALLDFAIRTADSPQHT